jgi:hypothetical protein
MEAHIMYNDLTPMGSSRPVFWDGQSSRRKEISRLSEEKSKTIANKAVVFLLQVHHAECMDCVSDRGLCVADFVYPVTNQADHTNNQQ